MGFKAGAAAKGDRGLADVLFSRIIRSRGDRRCQRCGVYPATDTAHIVKRRYSATRCLEDNAWLLCRRCHLETEAWPTEFVRLVERTIGLTRYYELRNLANDGIQGNSKRFWAEEVTRLKARCEALGLDTRRRIPA
jgi:hypothetical protein